MVVSNSAYPLLNSADFIRFDGFQSSLLGSLDIVLLEVTIRTEVRFQEIFQALNTSSDLQEVYSIAEEIHGQVEHSSSGDEGLGGPDDVAFD